VEFLTEARVRERYAFMRIDRYLARCYGYLSRSEWQREIRNGKIFYNGALLTRHDKKVRPGDSISYSGRDAAIEPKVDENYSILYEDDWLVAVDKPGNLPVHPAGVFYHNTLLTFLQNRLKMKLHLLHRLDRETSGVVVLAKDAATAGWFQKNFSSVKKAYLALVHGIPPFNDYIVDVPLDSDPASVTGHKRAAFPGAREKALTRFERLFSFSDYSLIKAVPYTGRQHQIRVHLKYSGFPIVGDKLYGMEAGPYTGLQIRDVPDDRGMAFSFHRSALHSRSILFRHPSLNKTICIKAPFPGDMGSFINREAGTDV
jgi:RluA family pseudouridine synthase